MQPKSEAQERSRKDHGKTENTEGRKTRSKLLQKTTIRKEGRAGRGRDSKNRMEKKDEDVK